MTTLSHHGRPPKARWSTAGRIAGAVIVAAAAHLSNARPAGATPVDFTLIDATATFDPTTYMFAGTFTFDTTATIKATNIAITAMPTNAANPAIVSSYTTSSGSLCSSFSGDNFLCVANSADTAALVLQFQANLDGSATPDAIIDISATILSGATDVQDVAGGLISGDADTLPPPPPPLVATPEPMSSLMALGIALIGLWGTYRVTRREHDRAMS
jgi:hypothetical protein